MRTKSLKENYIISNSDPKIIKWDLFIIALAVYGCITIPIQLSFNATNYWEEKWHLSRIIDILFGIDIIVSFRTS